MSDDKRILKLSLNADGIGDIFQMQISTSDSKCGFLLNYSDRSPLLFIYLFNQQVFFFPFHFSSYVFKLCSCFPGFPASLMQKRVSTSMCESDPGSFSSLD